MEAPTSKKWCEMERPLAGEARGLSPSTTRNPKERFVEVCRLPACTEKVGPAEQVVNSIEKRSTPAYFGNARILPRKRPRGPQRKDPMKSRISFCAQCGTMYFRELPAECPRCLDHGFVTRRSILQEADEAVQEAGEALARMERKLPPVPISKESFQTSLAFSDLTPRQLAVRAGVDEQTVWMLVDGSGTVLFHHETRLRLALALDVTAEFLSGRLNRSITRKMRRPTHGAAENDRKH